MGARHLAWLLLLLGLAACFSPTVPEGAPCQFEEQCPRPQRCFAGSCRLSPQAGDAATDGKLPTDGATDAPFPPSDAPPDAAIDAPPPMGCSMTGFNCPSGYALNSCNGMCFIRCTTAMTRAEAANRCAAWSGQLANLDTTAAISCALAATVPSSWIGLTQDNAGATPGAGWTWTGNAPLTVSAWAAGQPDDGDGTENGAEQCATATGTTFEDVSCSVTRGFICRR